MSANGNGLVIGDLQLITPQAQNILTATCASGLGLSCVAWDTGPTSSNQEGVFICKMLGTASNSQRISAGTGPDCFPFDSGGYVSWIVKDPKTDLWTIHLSTFDNDLLLSPAISPATSVANLVTRPYIGQFENEPCLIYLNTSHQDQATIHTYFIRSHRTIDYKLEIESANDMIVKSSANHLVITIEGRDELFLFTFNGRTWDVLAKIPKEGSVWPFRFDFALNTSTAMFIMEFEEGERIGSLAVNLSNGKFDRKWAISEYGKSPSIAKAPAGWLISWVGAPALLLDRQGKEYNPDNGLGYIKALNEIRLKRDSNLTDEDLEQRSEMERLWGASYVSPWSPLWLGELDDSGRCVNTFGPLGGGSEENFGTQISLHDIRGILLWRSYEKNASEEECVLKARQLIYSQRG